MTTFIAAPIVGVSGNNPSFGVIGIASNFEGIDVPYTTQTWIALNNSVNTGVQRPTSGQIFPLGNFYGGVPSLMSSIDGIYIAGLTTTPTTVPSTVTEVKIRLWANGGPGATSVTQAAGGGGGGGYCEGIYPVTPGSTLSTTLSTSSTCSVTGMTSGSCTANPGAAGGSSSGGAGGTASGGSINITGQTGGGPWLGTAWGSGSGGGSFGSAGGTFVINTTGANGQFPGGGGSGGSGANSGGAGGAPLCIMEWVQ